MQDKRKKPTGDKKPRPSAIKRFQKAKPSKPQLPKIDDGLTRLNKYIANAGVCSRREADVLIESGVVTVNGKVTTEMGTKIGPNDVVTCGGETLKRDTHRYVLLNKPKDFVTTSNDPHDRRAVLNLVAKACKERIYPVGKMDRTTTGVLLFTNDSDLEKRLTHPKKDIKKIFHVFTHKNVTQEDLEKLVKGVHIDGSMVKVHAAAFSGKGEDKKQVGIELRYGKNTLVKRMLEALGYKVLKMDLVTFAGLTKKDLPRGNWRHLTEKEVAFLKMQ